MICPECLNKDIHEINYDEIKQDVTYQCDACKFEFVVNITPEDEVDAHERERNLITEPAL